MDLLSVVLHELGHVVGLSDLDPRYEPHHLMAGYLQPGQQRSFATSAALASSLAPSATDEAFSGELLGSLTLGSLLSRSGNFAFENQAEDDESGLDSGLSQKAENPGTLAISPALERLLESRNRRKRVDSVDDFFADLGEEQVDDSDRTDAAN
jgi:hypothetical protein